VTYESTESLRQALEHRLRERSSATGLQIDRLRRRVLLERIVARLEYAEPGRWVLKGGMALEVRLAERARLTKDIDLAFREDKADAMLIGDRLASALTSDPHNDRFVFTSTDPELLQADGGGHVTWRVRVGCSLAGRPFGSVQLDISPRTHEVTETDRVTLPNSLDFADIPNTIMEIVELNRHAAEKFHGMTRDFGSRENSRVRDLVDLVILIDNELLDEAKLRAAVLDVWQERNQSLPPTGLPNLPESWPDRYRRLAEDHELDTTEFSEALQKVGDLWSLILMIGWKG
jgi:Nucleotidyl transferase AbiEii toxin, Type IV TA system